MCDTLKSAFNERRNIVFPKFENFDTQRQLNIQLQEQKRWLEHELEQIKLKIQTERQNPIPDPFSFDW